MATLTIDIQALSKTEMRAVANFMRELAGDSWGELQGLGVTNAPVRGVEMDVVPTGPTIDELNVGTVVTAPDTVSPREVITDPKPQAAAETVPSAAATAPSAPTAELDPSGLQWDERIHSTNKTTNANGTWKLRRQPKDMDKTQWAARIMQVKAELAAPPVVPTGDPALTQGVPGSESLFDPTAQVQTGGAEMPTEEMAAAFGGVTAGNGVVNDTPEMVAAFGNGQTLPSQEQTAALTWPDVLQRLAMAQNAGTFDVAKSTEFLAANNVNGGIPLLNGKPELFAAFVEYVGI